MSPLSALRIPVGPAVRLPGGVAGAAGAGGAGGLGGVPGMDGLSKAIPQQEMATLGMQGDTASLGGAGGLPKTFSAPDLAPSSTPQSFSIGQGGSDSFSNVLGQMVSEVNSKQAAAGQAVNGLLSGGNVSLHQAMIAMEEANVSFQLMLEVRNKLLDSYQEMMRMQV